MSRRLDKIENLKQRSLETKYRIPLRSGESPDQALQGGRLLQEGVEKAAAHLQLYFTNLPSTMGQAHVTEQASRASG